MTQLLVLSHVQLFCDPMDYSLPVFSVHVILQARIMEWVSISFSRGSSWPRDQTWVSCIGRWILYHWAAQDAHQNDILDNIWLLHSVPAIENHRIQEQGMQEDLTRNWNEELKINWDYCCRSLSYTLCSYTKSFSPQIFCILGTSCSLVRCLCFSRNKTVSQFWSL